jgi:hypothetical protein
MADHLDPRRLLPAPADNRLAAGWIKPDGIDEPLGHALIVRRCTAFDDHRVRRQIHHPDARVITAVENRRHHQLDHRRIVDIGRQRQGQRSCRILGVRTQLIDVLRPRTLQADDKTARERDNHKQTDCDQQLLEQRHQYS